MKKFAVKPFTIFCMVFFVNLGISYAQSNSAVANNVAVVTPEPMLGYKAWDYDLTGDGSVAVKLEFVSQANGSVSASQLGSVVLCASENSDTYKAVPLFNSNSNVNTYRVPVNSQPPMGFFGLSDKWEKFDFYFYKSENGRCESSPEQTSLKLKVKREKPVDKKPVEGIPPVAIAANRLVWVAKTEPGGGLTTKHVWVKLKPNVCGTYNIMLSSGVPMAKADGAFVCNEETKIKLTIEKNQQDNFLPDKSYTVSVDGKDIGTVSTESTHLEEFSIDGDPTLRDGDKTINLTNKKELVLTNKAGEKRFQIATTGIAKSLKLIGNDKCFTRDTRDSENTRNHTFAVDFSNCSEKLYEVRFSGIGRNDQPFEDDGKIYLVRLNTDTKFEGAVSFDYKGNSTILRYRLTRPAEHKMVVRPNNEGDEIVLRIQKDTSAKLPNSYIAEIPDGFVQTLSEREVVKNKLKQNEVVPIFFVVQETDGDRAEIGSFEIQAFKSALQVNKGVLEEIIKTKKGSIKSEEMETLARRALNLLPTGELDTPQREAVNNFKSFLEVKEETKRNGILSSLLKIGVSVGSRLIGFPIDIR